MIQDLLVKRVVDFGLNRIGDALRNTNTKLQVSTEDLETSLNYHLRSVKNWCGEISFADLRSPRSTDQAFVPLDVLVHPRRHRISAAERTDIVPLETAIEQLLESRGSKERSSAKENQPSSAPYHLVILGQPGAGKTTSMKHLCQRLITEESFLDGEVEFPIVIRLRELNSRPGTYNANTRLADDDVLFSRVQEILGIRLIFPPELQSEETKSQRRAIRDRILVDYLESSRALLILDGFDELASSTRRESVLAEIRILAEQLERTHLILTSRTGEFNYHIENTQQFEMSPMSLQQIQSFLRRWLGASEGDKLYQHIKTSPYADTTIRPLTLAHLCAIYERTHQFPEKPKTVYNKIVSLLIEQWDGQRSVKRESGYAHFDIYRKHEFLANLAYVLTTKLKSSTFTKGDVVNAYETMHENFGLPQRDAGMVANELEAHTGLFLQAGCEEFEFSHKSLQEYLAAEYIVRLPTIPRDPSLLARIPNELAIATAISSSPSAYFSHLVFERLTKLQVTFEFTRAFVNRLLIERPDFEVNAEAGAALLALYSIYSAV